tara:strand:- start:36 stop:257 length:222 start_codon:yes stop_codon:yes gene_type:complete
MYNNNVDSGRNMGEKIVWTETETKNELKLIIERHRKAMKNMDERIIRLERIIDALDRRMEGSDRHIEDEGWFD